MTQGRKPTRERRITELGEEVKCAMCNEFWPADPEFFYFSGGQPHSYCKACYATKPSVIEKRQRWRAKRAAQRATAGELSA